MKVVVPANRQIGILAMVVPVWFAALYLILASLRPEYRHLTKAISELGSVGAPRAWVWNLLGYVLPGAIVSLLGFGIGKHFALEAVLALLVAFSLIDRTASLGQLVGVAMVVGGGLGNLLDRVSHGVVRDFLNLGVGQVRTGIFNLADVSVTLGALALMVATWRGHTGREAKERHP